MRPSSGAETDDLRTASDNLDTLDRTNVSAAGTAALRLEPTNDCPCPVDMAGVRPSPGAETDDLRTASNNLNTLDRTNVSAAGTAALRELAAQIQFNDHD